MPVRLAIAALLLGGVLWLLWFRLFPVLDGWTPFTDVTVTGP